MRILCVAELCVVNLWLRVWVCECAHSVSVFENKPLKQGVCEWEWRRSLVLLYPRWSESLSGGAAWEDRMEPKLSSLLGYTHRHTHRVVPHWGFTAFLSGSITGWVHSLQFFNLRECSFYPRCLFPLGLAFLCFLLDVFLDFRTDLFALRCMCSFFSFDLWQWWNVYAHNKTLSYSNYSQTDLEFFFCMSTKTERLQGVAKQCVC